MRYFGDNVVFFWIDSIHSPGPGCGSGFLFRSPISWPKRNVKTHGAAMPVSLGREGTKIVASFFDGGFERKRREHI
jgi:hypothetical protein